MLSARGAWRRLEFIAANVAAAFCSQITLTYHAEVETWENGGARNGRIARRSKRDLNRFLSCLRREPGHYLWVQEFQERGVIHYHVLGEGELAEGRVAVAWCRATGELDDAAAVCHAVEVERIESQRGARDYGPLRGQSPAEAAAAGRGGGGPLVELVAVAGDGGPGGGGELWRG